MIHTFKIGDRVVSRFGSHNIVKNSIFDEVGQEWVTVKREDGSDGEFAAYEFTAWVAGRDEEWRGQ